MQIRSIKKVSGIILTMSLICLSVACEHELPTQQLQQPPVAVQPTLSSIQANIFTPKCVNAGCHPGGGAPMSLAAGVARANLIGVSSAYGKPRVAAGNANNSVLYLKVSGAAGVSSRMPLGLSALSTNEINAIRDWINAGALNN